MSSSLVNVCRFTPTTGGTTDWTYSAAVTGYQSPSAAGVVNGAIYSYRAESADLSQWEIGVGAYNTGTGVLARTTVLANSSGGTSKINFSTTPQVAIVALAEDLLSLEAHGQCILKKVSSNLVLLPFNGNLITINGRGCTVPAAGVSLAATSLTPGGNYYIYAIATAGVVSSLEASATSHATSSTAGNIGVEIKSGDDTRSLVGFARVITGPAWQDAAAQRFVRSWFNDPGYPLQGAGGVGSSNTTNSATYVEILTSERVEFLSWAGENVQARLAGYYSNNSTGSCYANMGVDGTSPVANEAGANPGGANFRVPFCCDYSANNLSEGYHYITPLLAALSAGSAYFYSTIVGGAGTRITGFLRK